MKTMFSKFALAAALAAVFSFSCSDDGGDGGGNGSPSGGGWGGSYESVTIGSQVWMKKNLNIEAAGSKCYESQEANCDKYGRFYDWATAKTICPNGWHLPSREEWNELSSCVQTAQGCSNCDAKHLKATDGWDNDGNGQDTYGFEARNTGDSEIWWSASESEANKAYGRYMKYSYDASGWLSYDKTETFHVRCIKD